MLKFFTIFFILFSVYATEYEINDVKQIIINEVAKGKEAITNDDWGTYQQVESKINKLLDFGGYSNYPEESKLLLLTAKKKDKLTFYRCYPLINRLSPTSGIILGEFITTMFEYGSYKEAFSYFLKNLKIIPDRGDYIFMILANFILYLGKGLILAIILVSICFAINNSEVYIQRTKKLFSTINNKLSISILILIILLTPFFPFYLSLIFIIFFGLIYKELKNFIDLAIIASILIISGNFFVNIGDYWFNKLGYSSLFEIKNQAYLNKVINHNNNFLDKWMHLQNLKTNANYDKALNYLKELPNNDILRTEEGSIYYYLKNYIKADEIYSKVKLETPTYLFNFSKIKFKNKEVNQSLKYLKMAQLLDSSIQLNDSDAETNYMKVEQLSNVFIYQTLFSKVGISNLWKDLVFDFLIVLVIFSVYGFIKEYRFKDNIIVDLRNFGVGIGLVSLFTPFRFSVRRAIFNKSIYIIVMFSLLTSILRIPILNLNIFKITPTLIGSILLMSYLILAFLTNLFSNGKNGRK